ncbi:hypothetical protein TTRE_0000639901, partial [Trichuris trichiura]
IILGKRDCFITASDSHAVLADSIDTFSYFKNLSDVKDFAQSLRTAAAVDRQVYHVRYATICHFTSTQEVKPDMLPGAYRWIVPCWFNGCCTDVAFYTGKGMQLSTLGLADTCGQTQDVRIGALLGVTFLSGILSTETISHSGTDLSASFTYDFQNCHAAACHGMISTLEQTITNASFAGRSFTAEKQTFTVFTANSFTYVSLTNDSGLRIFSIDISRLMFRPFSITPPRPQFASMQTTKNVLSKPLIGIAFALSEIKKFVGRIESTVVNRDGHYDFRLEKSNFELFFLNIRHRFAH